MKTILFLQFFLISIFVSAQQFSSFLHGTWKLEDKETFEHWDLINKNSLKGFSYQITNGKLVVAEYLEIDQRGEEITYTTTVLNQNQGLGFDFNLNKIQNIYSLENPNHDFSKFIQYELISGNEIKVRVGTEEKNFTLNFQKVE